MNKLSAISLDTLRRAVQLREQIDALTSDLDNMGTPLLGIRTEKLRHTPRGRKLHWTQTPEGRRRRRRWKQSR